MALKIENVNPLPRVSRDRPTDSSPPRAQRPARTARPSAEPVDPVDPLATPPRHITNRVPGALWDQLGQRAAELGLPVRVLLTDAIVRVLEMPADEHLAAAKATRRRERLARASLDD